jgi:hypothetical protein
MTSDLLGIAKVAGLIPAADAGTAAMTSARTAGFTTTVHKAHEIAPFETVVRHAAEAQKAAAETASTGASGSPATGATMQKQGPTAAEKDAKARKSFETFALQVFIGSMLPKEDNKHFGTGSAGKLWQSMMAEKLADQIAASGRLKFLPESAVTTPGSTDQASAAAKAVLAADVRKMNGSGETR